MCLSNYFTHQLTMTFFTFSLTTLKPTVFWIKSFTAFASCGCDASALAMSIWVTEPFTLLISSEVVACRWWKDHLHWDRNSGSAILLEHSPDTGDTNRIFHCIQHRHHTTNAAQACLKDLAKGVGPMLYFLLTASTILTSLKRLQQWVVEFHEVPSNMFDRQIAQSIAKQRFQKHLRTSEKGLTDTKM